MCFSGEGKFIFLNIFLSPLKKLYITINNYNDVDFIQRTDTNTNYRTSNNTFFNILNQKEIYLIFFLYPPSSGIAPCVLTAGTVQTPTLDTALLSSSRGGADLGRTSDNRV